MVRAETGQAVNVPNDDDENFKNSIVICYDSYQSNSHYMTVLGE